ncbi:MAG: hypothetical protein IID33_11765, partial [Planctomycetes bacterium]|nr:hypothetical protein [Planctomycetota bacterium]
MSDVSLRESAPLAGRWLIRLLLALMIAVGALAAAWGSGRLLTDNFAEEALHRQTGLYGGLLLVAAALAALFLQRRVETVSVESMSAFTKSVDDLSGRVRAIDLFAISFLGLFLEVL